MILKTRPSKQEFILVEGIISKKINKLIKERKMYLGSKIVGTFINPVIYLSFIFVYVVVYVPV